MTLINRHNPFIPTLSNIFDDFFDDDFQKLRKTPTIPAVNITENENNFSIQLAAPGLTKKDFDININNNVLSIICQKNIEKKQENEKFIKQEFLYSNFKRIFTLPENTNIEQINAEYNNGILTISIAKKTEEEIKTNRKININ